MLRWRAPREVPPSVRVRVGRAPVAQNAAFVRWPQRRRRGVRLTAGVAVAGAPSHPPPPPPPPGPPPSRGPRRGRAAPPPPPPSPKGAVTRKPAEAAATANTFDLFFLLLFPFLFQVQWDYAFDLTSADHQRQLYALAELLSDDAAIAALGVKPGKLGIASTAINPQLGGSSTGSLAHTASPTTAASSKPFGIQARRCRRVGGCLCSRFLPPGTRRYVFPSVLRAASLFVARSTAGVANHHVLLRPALSVLACAAVVVVFSHCLPRSRSSTRCRSSRASRATTTRRRCGTRGRSSTQTATRSTRLRGTATRSTSRSRTAAGAGRTGRQTSRRSARTARSQTRSALARPVLAVVYDSYS